jgi:hypothetical protein
LKKVIASKYKTGKVLKAKYSTLDITAEFALDGPLERLLAVKGDQSRPKSLYLAHKHWIL